MRLLSQWFDHHCNKRTCVDSQKVKTRSEHSSAHGNEDMPELILGTGTSFEQQGQEPVSPPPVKPGPLPIQKTGLQQGAQRVLGIRPPQTQELSRENVDDSDMDTASTDCISCSDTDQMSVQTACKRYQKKVQASCRLSKGSLWMEAQLKRISENCQDVWGHDYECVRAE